MKKKLCEIGEIIAGGTPSTKINEYWNGKISWITPKDLSNYKGRFISKGERSITEEGLNNSSAVLMPKNSILFTSRAPIGYVAIAEKELCTNQGFKSFVCNEQKCYYKYMYYWFLNNVETIKSKANGSTFQEVSGTVMKNIEIELPDMKTQKNIGNILDLIDRKIELNNQINNNLQEIINSIFKKWFIEFEFPILDGQYYKSSNGKMKDSELGKIPENWKVVKLENIIDFSNGYSIDSKKMLNKEEKNTYKVFKMGNIKPLGGINKDKTKSWLSKEYCTGLEKYISKKGDILMCMTDMKNSDTPLLGHTALIDKNNEFIINQRVGILRCKKELVNYSFVYTLTNIDFFVKDIRSRANSGVQVNLSTKGICETSLIFPDKKTLDEFNNIAEPMYEKIFKNNDENEVLIQIRDTLLPKLMNGEIDLDNIEI